VIANFRLPIAKGLLPGCYVVKFFKSALGNCQLAIPLVSHRHLSLQRDRFLIVRIDRDRA
jgi:hypothetical protein